MKPFQFHHRRQQTVGGDKANRQEGWLTPGKSEVILFRSPKTTITGIRGYSNPSYRDVRVNGKSENKLYELRVSPLPLEQGIKRNPRDLKQYKITGFRLKGEISKEEGEEQ